MLEVEHIDHRNSESKIVSLLLFEKANGIRDKDVSPLVSPCSVSHELCQLTAFPINQQKPTFDAEFAQSMPTQISAIRDRWPLALAEAVDLAGVRIRHSIFMRLGGTYHAGRVNLICIKAPRTLTCTCRLVHGNYFDELMVAKIPCMNLLESPTFKNAAGDRLCHCKGHPQ